MARLQEEPVSRQI